jgi:hypothetical protein
MMTRLPVGFPRASAAGHAVVARPSFDCGATTGTVLGMGVTLAGAGKRHRPHGSQSCPIGTLCTGLDENSRDCSGILIAVAAALTKDTSPLCAPAAGHTDLACDVCTAWAGGVGIMPGDPYTGHAEVAQNGRAARRGPWRFHNDRHAVIAPGRVARNPGVSP